MYSPCRYKFGRFAGDTRIITKMAKMPFVPGPRYAHEPDAFYKTHHRLREDVSSTDRTLIHKSKEIGLPRDPPEADGRS